MPFLSLFQQPHQSIKKIGNIVNQGMAHPGAPSFSFEFPYLVTPLEGPVLELKYQEAIFVYLHHLCIPGEPYLIDGFGLNGSANLVRTGSYLSELNSISGSQSYEPIKIAKDMEDARRWGLD